MDLLLVFTFTLWNCLITLCPICDRKLKQLVSIASIGFGTFWTLLLFGIWILLEKKKSRPESVDCTPPEYIIPGSRERPLAQLQPQSKEQKGPQCIKVLTTSGWNPPPGLFCHLSCRWKSAFLTVFVQIVYRLSEIARKFDLSVRGDARR